MNINSTDDGSSATIPSTRPNVVVASAGADWSQAVAGAFFYAESYPGIPIQAPVSPGASTSGRWELPLVVNYSGTKDVALAYQIQIDILSSGLQVKRAGDTQHAQVDAYNIALLDAKILSAGIVSAGTVSDYETGTIGLTTGSPVPLVITFVTPRASLADLRVWFVNSSDAAPDQFRWTLVGTTVDGTGKITQMKIRLNANPTTNNTTLKWSVGAVAAPGTQVLLADTTLASDAANIQFSGIAQNYNHLLIESYLRSVNSTADIVLAQINGDVSTTNYVNQYSLAVGSSITAGALTLAGLAGGYANGTNANANDYAYSRLHLPNYRLANAYRRSKLSASFFSASGENEINYSSKRAATSAISIVNLVTATGSNFKAGSRATLYALV